MNDIEQRCFSSEVRAIVSDDGNVITGYGAVFNSRSENLGGFREEIMPGAFDDVLDNDVRAYFNHDHNFILGRTSSGTLSLSVDERGLSYEIQAPTTPTINDLVIAPMQRGDIKESSFAFKVNYRDEEWVEDEEGVVIRRINKVSRLFDVSPVALPAYPDATAARRSLQQWQTETQHVLKRAVNEKAYRERALQLLNQS